MPALGRNPVNPFGSRTVTTAGTIVRLFQDSELFLASNQQWPTRCNRMYFEALNTNTGFVYIGMSNLNVGTKAGIICTLAPPQNGPAVFSFTFDPIGLGDNSYSLKDYWLDAAVSGEGLAVRTVWVA